MSDSKLYISAASEMGLYMSMAVLLICLQLCKYVVDICGHISVQCVGLSPQRMLKTESLHFSLNVSYKIRENH